MWLEVEFCEGDSVCLRGGCEDPLTRKLSTANMSNMFLVATNWPIARPEWVPFTC